MLRALRAPAPARAPDLPAALLRAAERAGAGRAHLVELSQTGEVRLERGGRWTALRARQVIALRRPGFVWQAWARTGGLPLLRVLDGYAEGRGRGEVRLLGLLRVAVSEGAEIDRAEAMRYLAELPWAPDALLANPDIAGRETAAGLEVDLGPGTAVTLCPDAAGEIAEVRAAARPAREGAGFVERPWRGHFRAFREMGGRRIPTEAEVGYLHDGAYEAYWRGRITGYRVREG